MHVQTSASHRVLDMLYLTVVICAAFDDDIMAVVAVLILHSGILNGEFVGLLGVVDEVLDPIAQVSMSGLCER
ncbi:hypothetical protein [Haloarcula amylovorans]|uniref:hypothetical protein n=1 Tax=Haloarcula amylovorans TaxID=2562280 RepID=UPI001075E204|nr:hypothetical protein [Halomicroarcula amylolytica]